MKLPFRCCDRAQQRRSKNLPADTRGLYSSGFSIGYVYIYTYIYLRNKKADLNFRFVNFLWKSNREDVSDRIRIDLKYFFRIWCVTNGVYVARVGLFKASEALNFFH